MANLSPQTQAVLGAFTGNDTIHGLHLMTPRLAAVLRAAADQLVPHPGRYPMNEYMEGLRDCKQDFCAALRAIADELEAANDH